MLRVQKTYAESLEVVHGDTVAVEVEESILQHAAVAVPRVNLRQHRITQSKEDRRCGSTHERTKRSRFSQLGFLGLNLINRLNRTWATGAMPLDYRLVYHPRLSLITQQTLGVIWCRSKLT